MTPCTRQGAIFDKGNVQRLLAHTSVQTPPAKRKLSTADVRDPTAIDASPPIQLTHEKTPQHPLHLT